MFGVFLGATMLVIIDLVATIARYDGAMFNE